MHTRRKSSDHRAVTIGVDIGKTTFRLVRFDKRGTIVLRTKVSRSQLSRRLANVHRYLMGLEAGSGAHHITRQNQARPRRAPDPGAMREAVSQGSQERLSRCRGGRGNYAAANDGLRCYQDPRAKRSTVSASRTRV